MASLVVEQPLLAPQLAAVADERAVNADDAVAGHQDRDLVRAIGTGDGAHSGGTPDALRDLTVAARLAAGDLAQGRPYLRGERRATLDDARVEGGRERRAPSGVIRLASVKCFAAARDSLSAAPAATHCHHIPWNVFPSRRRRELAAARHVGAVPLFIE